MTQPEVGRPETIMSGVRRILAPNAGPMTYWGTNTWLLGEGEVAVIDPGPDSEPHLDAVLRATQGQRISHVLVTHAHADHSGLARRLADEAGAPVYGFGPPEKGRSPLMDRLSKSAALEGGEGVDTTFRPDVEIGEADTLGGEGWNLVVRHIPGHFAGHLAFEWDSVVFSGDHVMAWATTLVSPPDGNMGDFLKSSERLASLGQVRFMPGHGAILPDGSGRLRELINHRRARETSILNALADGKETLGDITAIVYGDVPMSMHLAAGRNVLAHLIDLVERNRVVALPEIGTHARFKLCETAR